MSINEQATGQGAWLPMMASCHSPCQLIISSCFQCRLLWPFRKGSKEKDPEKPKQPMTAFLYFCNDRRKAFATAATSKGTKRNTKEVSRMLTGLLHVPEALLPAPVTSCLSCQCSWLCCPHITLAVTEAGESPPALSHRVPSQESAIMSEEWNKIKDNEKARKKYDAVS